MKRLELGPRKRPALIDPPWRPQATGGSGKPPRPKPTVGKNHPTRDTRA